MTSWKKGQGGRPRGARNKVKREVRTLMLRLEKDGDLDAAKWFRRLQVIALGKDLGAAVAAVKVLCEYRFGRPISEVELNVEHDLGPSVTEMLEEIARSDRHRAALEEREQRQLAAASL